MRREEEEAAGAKAVLVPRARGTECVWRAFARLLALTRPANLRRAARHSDHRQRLAALTASSNFWLLLMKSTATAQRGAG